MDNNYYRHISSEHRLFDLKLKEVWQYRELIHMFTKRAFAVSYKQTVLGPAWLFINPFLTSLIYVVLFGNIARLGTDGNPQLLFYFLSTAIWTFFSSCLSNNASTFTGNAGLFGKVYFPRLCVPVSNVAISVIKFAIQMIFVVLLLAYYGLGGAVHPHWWAVIVVPLVLVWLGIMGMGFGIIISSLTTKYRDLNVLVGWGVQLLHYVSPVVYPLSVVVAMAQRMTSLTWLKALLVYNPVAMPVEIFRYSLLGTGTIEMGSVIVSIIFTIIVGLLGIVMFNKVERTFMDTV